MHSKGPIVIVEDDEDEVFLYKTAFEKLGVEHLRFFKNGQEAYDYLVSSPENPFLIISDMKMPVMTGLELREKIARSKTLMQKTIPFIFRTGSANTKEVIRAYQLNVQGFFPKRDAFEDMHEQLKKIISYWQECLEPNTTEKKDLP
jgi:CheY-like chemotaxis protein